MVEDEKDAKKLMEESRVQIVESEKEIQDIKLALKNGTNTENLLPDENNVKVSVTDVNGLPETAKMSFSFQLSNPIEEKTLDKLYDPIDEEKSKVEFKAVNMEMATLSIIIFDDSIQVGKSDALDISTWFKLDAIAPKKVVREIKVSISPEYKSSNDDVVVVMQPDVAESDEKEKVDEEIEQGKETKSNDTELGEANNTDRVENETGVKSEIESQSAALGNEDLGTSVGKEVKTEICDVTLRVEFEPSNTDRRESLYAQLNEASKRKAAALEQLRKCAVDVSRSTNSYKEELIVSEPAVKSGFLNKKIMRNKKETEPNILRKWYEKTIGPNSVFRSLFPIMKNYCIFFGVVVLMHYKGDFLEFPSPV